MHGIPVLNVRGRNIAEAWENSLLALYEEGCEIATMYDREGDPRSRDCSMNMVIEDPTAEPMIHKDFPGGLEDLQEYTMEVLEGIKNHLVRQPGDEDDTRWEYTYNQRLFHYTVPSLEKTFDQVEIMAEKLAATPYTRRAQAITWKVWEDNDCYDPACLQSVWGRVTEENKQLYLSFNVRFRSNDAYKAAFMNIFALSRLQAELAGRISEKSGREVKPGRYLHQADSYHLYGSYFEEFTERFLGGMKRRSFEERTFNWCDVREIMEEARPAILEKAGKMR